MRSPSNVKEVQRLAGRLASLPRLLPKSAEKAQPLFKLLKNSQKFKWNVECETTFQEFKSFWGSPLILSKPETGKGLLLYLSITEMTVSAVLVQEIDKQQLPVY